MRSNAYTLTFTSIVTVILGLLLSIASTTLKEAQELNVAIDRKKNILQSVEIPEDASKKLSSDEVLSLFDQFITGIVINSDGTVAEGLSPDDLSEKDAAQFPVYIKQVDGKIEGYALPISGKGLWSTIYGYLALEPDGNTVKGITFYKHGETPGLGGEIEKEWFTKNFIKKTIFDKDGKLASITIVKGKTDKTSHKYNHQVDGISGATMTAKGVNIFLRNELEKFEPYLRKIRSGELN